MSRRYSTLKADGLPSAFFMDKLEQLNAFDFIPARCRLD
jgi:hypothetical protein